MAAKRLISLDKMFFKWITYRDLLMYLIKRNPISVYKGILDF